MNGVLYSHRLKSAVQQMVVELGLSLTLDDSRTDVNLADNEAMLRETAQLCGVEIHFETHDHGTSVSFFK